MAGAGRVRRSRRGREGRELRRAGPPPGLAWAAAAAVLAGTGGAAPARAGSSSEFAFGTSHGSVQIIKVRDPDVENAQLFLSNVEPGTLQRIKANNFFSSPAESSFACTKSGRLVVDPAAPPKDRDIYQARKQLVGFKSVKVHRIYDAEDQTLIYTSYADDIFSDSREPFKTSVCALHIDAPAP